MSGLYALIEHGQVVNIIVANDWHEGVEITNLDPQPGIGWEYDGASFTPPEIEETVQEPQSLGSMVTRLAFLNRFTQAERVALEIAALDVPDAAMESRILAASIRVMMQSVYAANFIDLGRADTRAGVERLGTSGLISIERAAEILDTPVEPHEVPK